jgi:signal transduction histidine kinase
MQAATVASSQLLPPEVSASSGTWFGRARSYPIFSAAWYRYRSLSVLTGSALVFLVLVAMLGASMFNAPAVNIDWVTVAMVTGMIVAPFCTLCLAGPGLAVAVRRLGLRRNVETGAILAALLLGMALSAGLLSALISAYQRPRFDFANDTLVIRSLPAIHFKVQAMAGATTQFSGQRTGKGMRMGPEVEQAIKAVATAQLAAAKKPEDQMYADLGREAQLAIQTMQKVDAGDLAVDPARRAEIEEKYAAAIEKMYWDQPRALAAAIAAGNGRQASPEEDAAAHRLHTAMHAQAVAQVLAQQQAQAQAGPGPAPDPLSSDLGKFAVAFIGCAALLLAGWLGGLFDLAGFVRQRGKLVEVLQREELKRAQAARNSAELRLSVLAAQVEPHFLFNTLASVRSAISTDPQRATQIVDHMVSFLRSTIPQMRDDAASATVRLSTQLDSARSYLALMHERIPRLQFSVDAEPGLEHASIPPLTLISLVENAVKHGVEPKIGPARIDVRARRIEAQEAMLEVCVSDDGVGFGDAASGGGIGLANIQERLRSYFGQRASLTLKALPEGGVAAILRLPLSFEP